MRQYRRTGFNCENLIIANCEFFYSLPTFDSQAYSIISPPLRAICTDTIIKFAIQLKRYKCNTWTSYTQLKPVLRYSQYLHQNILGLFTGVTHAACMQIPPSLLHMLVLNIHPLNLSSRTILHRRHYYVTCWKQKK